jgi:hypothetical protein
VLRVVRAVALPAGTLVALAGAMPAAVADPVPSPSRPPASPSPVWTVLVPGPARTVPGPGPLVRTAPARHPRRSPSSRKQTPSSRPERPTPSGGAASPDSVVPAPDLDSTQVETPGPDSLPLPGVTVCVGVDVPGEVVIRVEIGECHRAPPPPPPPPPPAPRPTPTPAPSRPEPRSPSPSASSRPALPVPPPRTTKPPRPSPSVRPTPTRHTFRPRAEVPVRRQNPLATVLVLVVLLAVIAGGAGIAFAR